MPIETLDDIVEALADQLCCYGPERLEFVPDLKDRIRHAAKVEYVIEERERMQQQIDSLTAYHDRAIRALTLLYESLGRQGWEPGMTENEARDVVHGVLCDYFGDPYPRKDRVLPGEEI